MAAITYSPQEPIHGGKFDCPRCQRVHPFPKAHGRPVRCECGWMYTNVGGGKIVEQFHPRIGGDDRYT